MQNSAISFSACCDSKEKKIESLCAALADEYIVSVLSDCTLLTIYNLKNEFQMPTLYKDKNVLLKQVLGEATQLVLRDN